MPKAALLDLVKAGIEIKRPGVVPWIDRMPAAVRKELAAVKAWYHDEGRRKKFPLKSVARSIETQLKARKLKCPTAQTVEVWLREAN